MNPVDVTISSFTYFILPNINDSIALIYKLMLMNVVYIDFYLIEQYLGSIVEGFT